MISGANHPLDRLDEPDITFEQAIEACIDGAIYERDLLWVRSPLEREFIMESGSDEYNPEYWDEILEECNRAQEIYENCADDEEAITKFHYNGLERFADALESGCYNMYLTFS